MNRRTQFKKGSSAVGREVAVVLERIAFEVR